jgi:DNA-binding NtrC family response regulator
VRKKSPDAILMDVRLPDISGLEAYDHIRQIDSRLPVVIMTSFARTETAIEATRRGAFDYLIKPVDIGKLRTIMNRANFSDTNEARSPVPISDASGSLNR